VWDDIRQNLYTYKPSDKHYWLVEPGHTPDGGTQVIHKWENLMGQHSVTTHAVVDENDWPVHWCAKDLIIGDIKYIHRHSLDQ